MYNAGGTYDILGGITPKSIGISIDVNGNTVNLYRLADISRYDTGIVAVFL
ncbi:hypothetical protein D3C85_1895850 [compost metagenome]